MPTMTVHISCLYLIVRQNFERLACVLMNVLEVFRISQSKFFLTRLDLYNLIMTEILYNDVT